MKYLDITRTVTLKTRVPFNDEYYPGQTLEDSVAQESNLDNFDMADFVEGIDVFYDDDQKVIKKVTVDVYDDGVREDLTDNVDCG